MTSREIYPNERIANASIAVKGLFKKFLANTPATFNSDFTDSDALGLHRVENLDLDVGIEAKVYADLTVWKVNLAHYPSEENDGDGDGKKTIYNPSLSIFSIPTIELSDNGAGSCSIDYKLNATVTNPSSLVENNFDQESVKWIVFPSTGAQLTQNSFNANEVAFNFTKKDNYTVYMIGNSEKLGNLYGKQYKSFNVDTRGCVTDFSTDINGIVHDGKYYNTIVSETTNRVWLDRNLGASKVCTDINESACYGDYYQWGRDSDGHELVTSEKTSLQSESINPNHGNFISSNQDWITIDPNGTQRQGSWNICPSGFAIPTIDELLQEDIIGSTTALEKLSIPVAGGRYSYAGFGEQGSHGRLWSKDTGSSGPYFFGFIEDTGIDHDNTFFITGPPSDKYEGYFANAYPVRCIQIADANPGENRAAVVDSTVYFNAKESEGNIIEYSWKEGNVTLSTDMNFTKSDFSNGKHTIALSVKDVNNLVSTKEFIVNIGSIVHENMAYNSVISPHTGREWIDRNLGALDVCTPLKEKSCIGSSYQWGRDSDGHEKSGRTETNILAASIDVGHDKYIQAYSNINNADWVEEGIDSDGKQRYEKWSSIDGSSICPAGYRVPNISELKLEIVDINDTSDDYLYSQFLKLNESVWASDKNGASYTVYFNELYNYTYLYGNSSYSRAHGVRCIKHEEVAENNQSSSVVKKTGQFIHYALHDDGYYQIGKDSNYSRDNNTSIVTDHITNLQWQDDTDVSIIEKNFVDAHDYCDALALGRIR